MGDLNSRLLAEVGAEAFFRSFVAELRPQGQGLVGLCPLHDDRTPSFAVFDLSHGLWRCRAGCGSGDMVQFFAAARGMPHEGKEAFKALARALEKEFLNGSRPAPAAARKPPEPTKLPVEECSRHAVAYLEQWPPVTNYHPSYGVRLYAKGTPQEALLLPVHHVPSGLVVSVKTRFLTDQRRGQRVVKSLNMAPWCRRCDKTAEPFCYGDHVDAILKFPGGLIGLEALKAFPESIALLCEGEKDMLAGSRRLPLERYIPCSFSTGASSFPEGSAALLAKRKTLLCYDADRSGRGGMTRCEARLSLEGGVFSRADLQQAPGELIKGTPESKDLYDYFAAGGDPAALAGWFDGMHYDKGRPPGPPGDEEDPRGSGEDRPRLESTVRIHEVLDETEAILVRRDVKIYKRLGRLVRVVREEREEKRQKEDGEVVIRSVGAPIMRLHSLPTIRCELSRNIQYTRYDAKKMREVDTVPPSDIAAMLLEKGEWAFPTLNGFATAPFLRPDGSICDKAGYDRATGIMLEPDEEFDPVPAKPTKADAMKALTLLAKPFEHFPFVDGRHLAATMAAMLTLVARPAIDGPCPMFMVSAPTPGSGKTLLVWLAVSIVTGKKPASTDWVRDDDEFRKTVISMGLAGDRAVLLDNVEGTVGSGLLSNILTSDEFRGRLLGVNEMVDTKLNMVWFATGNNLQTRSDAFRRTVPILIDPHMEHPERRRFEGDHADVMAYARRLRPRLIPAILTILKAYHLAGHPKPDKYSPLGSFESWDDWVCRPLLWAMGVSCTRPTIGEDDEAADSEVEMVGGLLREWRKAFPGDPPMTVRGVVAHSRTIEGGPLLDALVAFNHKGEERPIPKVIAGVLRRYKGRIINGLCVSQWRKNPDDAAQWKVQEVLKS